MTALWLTLLPKCKRLATLVSDVQAVDATAEPPTRLDGELAVVPALCPTTVTLVAPVVGAFTCAMDELSMMSNVSANVAVPSRRLSALSTI